MKKMIKVNFKKRKTNKGITLIALVVTIIVLLILAGISISMLTGQNGILSRAGEAKEKTEYTNLKEEVQMVLLGREMTSGSGGTNTKTLKEDLEQQIGNAQVTEVNGLKDTCYVKRGNAEITVYENGEILEGKVSVWDGSKKECPELKKENNIWNWYIYTPEQLKFLADFVNNGNSLTGTVDLTSIVTDAGYNTSDVVITENETTVYLMNNLDMGARAGVGSTEEQKWETESNEAIKWTPIGIDNETKKFIGIFEGNNKTIKGLYVKREEKFNGIFGNSNTIQNLTIENSYIKGKNCTAGIVGALRNGKIENCHNKNTTAVLIAGENNTVGGVVGQCSGNTLNCSNSGFVLSYSNGAPGSNSYFVQMGGIIGYSAKEDNVISECTNKGTIKSLGLISNNISTFDGAVGIGGIVGIAWGTIEKCENYGIINANNKILSVGGIVGHLNSSSTIRECVNRGNITKLNSTDVINYVGGICGDMAAKTDPNITDSTLEKCYNSGSVEGNKWIGGILGYLEGTKGQGTVKECYNKGTVTGTNKVGSIIGDYSQAASNLNTFNDLYYLTTVGIGAINNGPDDTSKKIMALPVTSGNFNSKNEFLNWLANENNP